MLRLVARLRGRVIHEAGLLEGRHQFRTGQIAAPNCRLIGFQATALRRNGLNAKQILRLFVRACCKRSCAVVHLLLRMSSSLA